MIDLLYLTFNRLEFTRASLRAMKDNTNWDKVSRVLFYDDGSTDGTLDEVKDWAKGLQSGTGVPAYVHCFGEKFGNPVAIMNDYLVNIRPPSGGDSMFVKIDSDVMLPPEWLDKCDEVMRRYPKLDILGIEPPKSRMRPQWDDGARFIEPGELEPGPLRWIPSSSIGGIGIMRHACFKRFPLMRPHSTYGGFTEWMAEKSVAELRRGWIAPPLDVFLLDRMPTSPWYDLSQKYIANGWQRLWNYYKLADADLWKWAEGYL